MSKIWFILFAALLLQASRACDDRPNDQFAAATREDSEEYLANAYGYGPNQIWDQYYYQPNPRVAGFNHQYEGRTPMNKQPQPGKVPFKNYFTRNNIEDISNQPEGRFGLGGFGASIINSALFNNRFNLGSSTNRPFAGLSNLLPVTLNPNFANPIAAFDSCTAPSGESGICAPGSVCSLFGGRPSGSCLFGGVCCINAVTTCGGTITLNNTYWQSPSTAVSSSSTCALTVKMDTKLVEQKRSVCQVRLDFISFTTAQPTAGDCTDTFRVGGAINTVPVICGDNSGQHMYLNVPPSDTNPTDLQLMLNFGTSTTTRTWNIKISMLPCGAYYLAPPDCLQYFTASTGKVSSFNWKDVAVAGVRQLNNQLYNICFRTELIDSQRASKMCLTTCTTTTVGADAFWLTGLAAAADTSNSGTAPAAPGPVGCLTDYILFLSGTNALVSADRFCGGGLNPAVGVAGAAGVQVCSAVKPFRITYNTDAAELVAADVNNQGFCLSFQQS